jgi:hypothetical protein
MPMLQSQGGIGDEKENVGVGQKERWQLSFGRFRHTLGQQLG